MSYVDLAFYYNEEGSNDDGMKYNHEVNKQYNIYSIVYLLNYIVY